MGRLKKGGILGVRETQQVIKGNTSTVYIHRI